MKNPVDSGSGAKQKTDKEKYYTNYGRSEILPGLFPLQIRYNVEYSGGGRLDRGHHVVNADNENHKEE